MIDFAIIGVNQSKYALKVLDHLAALNIAPKYVIIEDHDPKNLANTAYYLDSRQFPDVTNNTELWETGQGEQIALISKCIKDKIPFFVVPDHNGRWTKTILTIHPIDILTITEGPIIRGQLLYMPRYCVMNVHVAPLPQYRGNWTTRIALYNDEPPVVSAHVVTPWIDEGPIIQKMQYSIQAGDTLEDIDIKALDAAASLAANALLSITNNGFTPQMQRIWEGSTYQGKRCDRVLKPAMPCELQEELRERTKKGEYGFYSD